MELCVNDNRHNTLSVRHRFHRMSSPVFSKFMKFRLQPGLNFLVTDPTDINKLIPHGDIVQVVQIAEHTDLAKLGNPRQQSELDATVHCLQHSIEGFQYAPIYSLKLLIADGLQHGLVIFVYQNGNPLPRLLVSTFYHAFETEGEGCLGRSGTVDSFPVGQKSFSISLKSSAVSYFEIFRSICRTGRTVQSFSSPAMASPSNNSLLPWK